MSENNFELEKEYLEEETSPEEKEAIFEDFNEKESVIQKETEGFLMKLVPEKFKKEAVACLAALSIVTSAASTFAEGLKKEEINKGKLSPENQIEETTIEKLSPQELFEKMIASDKKDEFAPFDWEKFADKIEISVSGEFEKIPKGRPEAIQANGYNTMIGSDFYKDLSHQEFDSAIDTELNSIFQSNNSKEFFTALSGEKNKLSDDQKTLVLQYIGNALGRTYNFDMLEKNQHIEISDDAMFSALRELLMTGKITRTGICGNIHTFLTKIAKSLGLEAWLQNGSTEQGGHVWSGFALDINGKRKIGFSDYGTLILTDTEKYPEALGVAERYHRSVATFHSFVSNEKEVLFPVKSRAQEVVEKAAGIEETAERLEGELSSGELKKERGLEINVSPEVKEIKLNKDTFAVAYFNFQDFNNNPYQSLEDLNALRGRLNVKSERLGFEADATVVHINIKDLYGGNVAQDEIITRLAADYIDSHAFTKEDYGKFILNFGATFQGALSLPLDEEIGIGTMSNMSEAGAGMRLIYINPSETGKFYIGAQEMFREQKNDFQNQDPIIKEVAKTFTVGTGVKVNEVQVLNLEAAGSELDWGKKIKIKGGVASEKWKGELGYEKATSEYERFIPSSEKISAEVGYRGGPKWKLIFIGSKITEAYSGAESSDTYDAEVKLEVFLW